MEQLATEFVLIAIATRDGLTTVERGDQWCLTLSSIRLAHRLAVGSLSPNGETASQVCGDDDGASPGPLLT
jgi:hypothetical protein